MSLQGPIIIIAEKQVGGLIQAFTEAGAFPVVETQWADAPAAIRSIRPAAVVLADPQSSTHDEVDAVARQIAASELLLPVIARVRDSDETPIDGALPISAEAPIERLIARTASALRQRALHATVLRRAATLQSERGITAELPTDDPLEDATVLVVGRGRSHPVLSVAVGERMGLMGALSVEAAAGCLDAREVDGIVIGDGLPARGLEAFVALLGDDARFRDMPIGALGAGLEPEALPNFVRADTPHLLVERITPLVRMHAFEGRLKRLAHSIESKGMLDARTGLLTATAFGNDLGRAIEDAGERGASLSIARFAFDDALERRSSLDAGRLVSQLIRNVDFACQQDDGSIFAVFTETDLRHAHVVARRLAAVLKHTMLRPGGGPSVSPSVTLATLKPGDTVLTLLARIAPRPVAAE